MGFNFMGHKALPCWHIQSFRNSENVFILAKKSKKKSEKQILKLFLSFQTECQFERTFLLIMKCKIQSENKEENKGERKKRDDIYFSREKNLVSKIKSVFWDSEIKDRDMKFWWLLLVCCNHNLFQFLKEKVIYKKFRKRERETERVRERDRDKEPHR